MKKSEQVFKPLSLAQHFEAPEDYAGSFGWICGYSADIGFLDDAVERFTRRMRAQRAYQGRIALALMLDPSNQQITTGEVPGVSHLPLRGTAPFRLLHAKVAVLGFRHLSNSQRWRLRLIVSTGNWTRQTLEESLDLAWRLDISDEDLESNDAVVTKACADLRAAWEMLDWLRNCFDCRLVNLRIPGHQEYESPSATVEEWIAKAITRSAGLAPRFFDNRATSLLAQLPELVKTQASPAARNYLGMGSGYYESPDHTDAIPTVLENIVARLQNTQLLTRQPEIDVFVNPRACQAVATSAAAINKANWKIRDAGQPECFTGSRSLHAKFIFSAIYRENSAFCNSSWLYLGSGNLTGPGFANPMAAQSGNLEAGVMITPEFLRWRHVRGLLPESVVTNVLPMQWETNCDEDIGMLEPGDNMPDPEVLYSAAPIAYCFWISAEDGGWLQTTEQDLHTFDLLNDAGEPCPLEPNKGFPWRGSRPLQVRVQWSLGGEKRWAWVPVIDEFGRIAAPVLPEIDIEEAWNQLADFPMPPAEEDLLASAELDIADDLTGTGPATSSSVKYPVRQMMQLVENIAAKQSCISEVDWVTWCNRLEQCLALAAGNDVLKAFLKLGLNPLSPLWHPAFRPNFAETDETHEGRRYEEALKRVEACWGVVDHIGFGVQG